MPGVTSLAKDLDNCSTWFFRARPKDMPWREITERLCDLSKYVESLPADDPQIQRWDRVERLIALRGREVYFDDVAEWEAVAEASTKHEALETFLALRAEDMISWLLSLGGDRRAVWMMARAVDITPKCFEEIVARVATDDADDHPEPGIDPCSPVADG